MTQIFEDKSITILPSIGFCVKLKSESKEKVFLNICTSEKVFNPRDIPEGELRAILDDIDNSPPFKIPMGIGEPHAEVDSAHKGCTAYDIVINPKFYEKVKSSELFEAFLITVILEGLENKYGIKLEREWIVLKNKKCMGTPLPQCIRISTRPAIVEMDNSSSREPKVIELPDPPYKGETPKCELVKVKCSDSEELCRLVARITLSKLI
ncbi:unnamed protein product [Heterobilharzia americana]|nr:unnamed protein product [Heterobilharzia americana]